MKEKGIVKFFDRLEDKIRARLSRTPILYAAIGGTGIILFWRGVWMLADRLYIGWLLSAVIGLTMLLMTGLLVASFIGDQVIISGLKREKKLAEKTEAEVLTEDAVVKEIKKNVAGEQATLTAIKADLERLETHIAHLEAIGNIDHKK